MGEEGGCTELRTGMSARVLLATIAVACLCEVSANSLGLGFPVCNAYDAEIWKPLDKGGKYMWWATAPKHSVDFTLRTGDGTPSSDAKSYTPGELLYIHVRANKRGHKFRGLLLYATDSKGNKVGGWELPKEDKINFHTPPGSCEGKSVTHSGADEKNYHNVFPFRAPPKTTGTIQFEALLKVGPANTGYFAWPNTKKLTLSESKVAPKQQLWFKGSPGVNCAATCRKLKGTCYAEGFTSINNAASLQSAIGRNYACKQPMLKACSKSLPSEATSDSFCSYAGCATKPNCGTVDAAGSRFCPCKGVSAATLLEVKEIEKMTTEMTEQGESEDEWSEISSAGKVATTADCSSLVGKDACETAGCVFSEEEGMETCSKTNSFQTRL